MTATVTPRTKSAGLWGAVGFLSVLVLLQGYALVEGPLLSAGEAAALALVVGVAASLAAYVLERRIGAWAARRTGT